jgi:hypothetical protein
MQKILRVAILAAVGTLTLTACVSKVESPGTVTPARSSQPSGPTSEGAAPSLATSLVIEHFLRAVNAKDLDTMARLFGTRDGSIALRDPRQQVEDRMFALSAIMTHQDYSIDGSEIVPGRRDEALQVFVRMSVNGRGARVPFTLVWAGESWMIEQIGIETITNGR